MTACIHFVIYHKIHNQEIEEFAGHIVDFMLADDLVMQGTRALIQYEDVILPVKGFPC